MKLYTNDKDFALACKSIKRRGAKLDKSIQQAALSLIALVNKNRDATIAATLLDAMPSGSRSNALKAYLETFGQLKWVEAVNKVPAHFAFDRDAKMDMQGAASIMWTEFKPEPVYKPLGSIAESVTKMLNKVMADIEHGHEHDETAVEALKELNTRLNPSPADAI